MKLFFNKLGCFVFICLFLNGLSLSSFAEQIEFVDTVRSLRKAKPRVKVIFRMHAGIYYLDPSHDHFPDILKLLKFSQAKKMQLVLKVDSDTLVIQDAQSLVVN